jgi:protein-L-isoaspartate(D-aspartate) O-methyltransferase
MFRAHLLPWLLLILLPGAPAFSEGDAELEAAIRRAQDRLAVAISAAVSEAAPLTGRESLRADVLEAVVRVPRHRFVPPELLPHAYQDRPLPISATRSLSQPFIVALMTDLLTPRATDRVLEIGTGTGYQTAVLAQLVAETYTVEIDPDLYREAKTRLAALGLDRGVHFRHADGFAGWAEQAPFDAIVVRGALSGIPAPLLEQLAPGGRLVLPLESAPGAQFLTLVEKDKDEQVRMSPILPIRFRPLPRPDTVRPGA